MPENEKILVAPLNWGLGHATRCIPVIKELLKKNYQVIIASDGEALELLKKEFPELPAESLPSYHIRYTKKARFLPFALAWQSLKARGIIKKEYIKTGEIIKKYGVTKIISDNRYGVYNPKVKSIFITHQLRVFSGIFTPLSSFIQKKLTAPFNEIWVPDFEKEPNLSGKLSHDINYKQKIIYLGPKSRFKRKKIPVKRDILILLSGPEPQRSLLQEKLMEILANESYNILLVEGKIQKHQISKKFNNIKVVNFLLSDQLEQAIQSSKIVIARSGYTSIMDFHKLKTQVLYIPTPGQFEQEYLARHLYHTWKKEFILQNELKNKLIEKLKQITG